MYLKFGDTDFADGELGFLRDLFVVLDARLDEVQQEIDASRDPDQFGLLDDAEYLCGMGLVACQRYLSSTYGPLGISKPVALGTGPTHSGGETYARIINSSANYWKHVDEWDLAACVARDKDYLSAQQQETVRIIESVTRWADYTCTNIVAALASPDAPTLAALLPRLGAWRTGLDALAA